MNVRDTLKKNEIWSFPINMAVLALAYGGFFREGFAGDAISQKIWPVTNIETWVMNGRFLSYLIGMGLYRIGINPVYHYKVFYICFIILIAVSMTIVQRAIADDLLSGERTARERLVLYYLLSIIYVNGLFCENFMFPECFLYFSLSYFFCALAMRSMLRGRAWMAAVWFLIAAMLYQAPMIMTVMILIAVWWNRMIRDEQKVGRWAITSVGLFVFSTGLILVTLRIGAAVNTLQSGFLSKEVEVSDVSYSVTALFRYILLFFKSGMGLLPPLFLPAIVFLVPLILLIRQYLRDSAKINRRSIPLLLLLSAGLIVMSFIIVFGAGMKGVVGRLLGGLYATLAMLLSIAYVQIKGGCEKRVIVITGVGFLLIQIVFCNTIMMNHYISNALDLEYAEQVYEQIKRYEKESGQEIRRLAYTQDAVCLDSYSQVYYKFGEINTRAIQRTGWILVSYVAMKDGRSFERLEMDDTVYETYFKDRDWDCFVPQEQLVFQDDALYWCVY